MIAEILVRFGAPLGYAAAVPALMRLHPQAPLLLALALPGLLVAGEMVRLSPDRRRAPRALRPWLVGLTVAAFLGLIGWGAAAAASVPTALPALVVAIGLGAGVFAMVAAHELIHSRAAAGRALGLSMLTAMGYRHFRISHIHGHHRHAVTAGDPGTAHRGESVYAFVGRAIHSQAVATWRHESRRCARRGLAVWRHRMVQDLAVYGAILASLAAALGLNAAVFFVLQSLVAIVVLEMFNYVAHYGLARDNAPLTPDHSWNAVGEVGNWLLLDMGHHSAHHEQPAAAGVAAHQPPLRTLPGGYAGAILLALLPGLWRRRMDRRLDMAAPGLSHAAILLVCVAGALLSGCGAGRLPPVEAPPPESAAVARGAYLVAAGNCASCHTDKDHDGRPFAGGGAVATPFGVYYSRNITPDRAHGIGAWSDAAFLRALRRGVSPSGEYYFPAFPYTAFTGMTDRDMLDIKAYLMTQAPAVAANKPPAVPFPYNVRTAVGAWRLLYFKEGPLKPDPAKSSVWNRGNYLVNAVGHCAECHTARTALGGLEEKRRFAGGKLSTPGGKTIPNYATRVPNITRDVTDGIGAWSDRDMIKFLQVGQRPNGDFVAAPMSEVIAGTAKLTDADREAIAVYLKSLPTLPGRGG